MAGDVAAMFLHCKDNGRGGRIRTCIRPFRRRLAYPVAHAPVLAATEGIEPSPRASEARVISTSLRRREGGSPGWSRTSTSRFVISSPHPEAGLWCTSKDLNLRPPSYRLGALPD